MKRVLVPCDFSEEAISAFRVAIDMAQESKSEVYLLNVIELPVLSDPVLMPAFAYEEELINDLSHKAQQQFEGLLKKYSVEGIKIKGDIKFGRISLTILDYIHHHNIDLVIMGTKGVSGVKEFFVGSNTEKVVRNAKVPVLAVKKYIQVSTIKNIVFPNTLETDNQEELVMKIKALQAFFNATLHIVWINTPTNFMRDTVTHQRLLAFAKRFMIKDYTTNIFNDVYEESGIINFALQTKADMIAMGTHGRKGLAHMFGGSIAEDVVNHAGMPIWTFSVNEIRPL